MTTIKALIPTAALNKLPSINEEFSKQSIVYVHLFNGAYDFYCMGYDPSERLMFGYARFASMPDCAEFGYTSLDELEQANHTCIEQRKYLNLIEFDKGWTPKPFDTIDID